MVGAVGKVFPEYQVALSGESVTINCYSASRLRWMRNGNLLSVIGALVIENITQQLSGSYTCHGYRDRFKIIKFKASAKVLVAGSL